MYIIIVGGSKDGEAIMNFIHKEDNIFVIDKDKEKLDKLDKKYDDNVITFTSDITIDGKKSFDEIQIEKADAFITTADEGTNLMVIDIIKKLKKKNKVKLISIVNSPINLSLYRERKVITVNKQEIIGRHLYGGALGIEPDFMWFWNSEYKGTVTDFVMFKTPPLPKGFKEGVNAFGNIKVKGKKLNKQGVSIRIIEREGKLITNPSGEDIKKGDKLVLITPIELVNIVLKKLGFRSNFSKRVQNFFERVKELNNRHPHYF